MISQDISIYMPIVKFLSCKNLQLKGKATFHVQTCFSKYNFMFVYYVQVVLKTVAAQQCF